MKELNIDEKTFRKLEERAIEKGMTITDYVSSLVPLVQKGDN